MKKLYDYMNFNFPEYKENAYIGTNNDYVKIDELKLLLDGDYKQFDKKFFHWFRKKKWAKDSVKSVLAYMLCLTPLGK